MMIKLKYETKIKLAPNLYPDANDDTDAGVVTSAAPILRTGELKSNLITNKKLLAEIYILYTVPVALINIITCDL